MPGMNSGLNVSDPSVVAAFKAALVHRGLIALLIFALAGLVWLTLRVWLPASAGGAGAAPPPEATAAAAAEPAWRRVLRIGFGLIWVFDGILQASRRWRSGSRRRSSSRPRPARRRGCPEPAGSPACRQLAGPAADRRRAAGAGLGRHRLRRRRRRDRRHWTLAPPLP
jgi:hypothetical protein